MAGRTKDVILIFLSLVGLILIWYFVYPINKSRQYENKSIGQWCSELHLINKLSSEDENLVTALASFPGSGNTWLRFILQQATGIYTASVFSETLSLTNGIPLQMINSTLTIGKPPRVINSSALVVKTHYHGLKEYDLYDKAVLLIRDPLKSILAEYNREGAGKTGTLSKEAFTGANQSKLSISFC
jgi:hypothetical protein